MKMFCLFLSVLAVGVCVSMVAPSAAVGATIPYATRLNDTAVSLDPATVAYGGAQSSIMGCDISEGGSYAYMVDDSGVIHRLARGTLSDTGVITDASTGWDSNDIFVSVDVGADGYLYAARQNSTALKIDPVTLTYAGRSSFVTGGVNLLGCDISVGSDYAYMVQGYAGNDTIVQLNKDTLQYTGVQSNWGGGNIMLSVDVGPDGYVYAARNGDSAVKLDPVTLAYAGVQSGNNGVDISMGPDYAYLAQTDGTDSVLLLNKNTLAYAGYQTNWGGGSTMRSIDVSNDAIVTPEPGAACLLLLGVVGLLAYAWRKRK